MWRRGVLACELGATVWMTVPPDRSQLRVSAGLQPASLFVPRASGPWGTVTSALCMARYGRPAGPVNAHRLFPCVATRSCAP